MKHFLRREYGTFRLYSGTDAAYTSILTWVRLYLSNLAENFSLAAPLLILAGLVSVLRTGRGDRTGLLVAGSLMFYWLVFHNLANLPTDDLVLLGVHMRFWMQAHMLAATLLVPGCMGLVAVLTGCDAAAAPLQSAHVLAGAVAVVAVQGGMHLRVSDQSNNFYFEQYGRSMLAAAAKVRVSVMGGW